MRSLALGIALALAYGSNASAATFTTFTNRTVFDGAAGLLTIENFNSVVGEPSFAGVALTVGDLTLEAGPSIDSVGNQRNFIDQPTVDFSAFFDIDGTALANVLLFSDGDTLEIDFATPVTAFGADFGDINFGAANNDSLRTAILVLGQQIAMPINSVSLTFFGLISDTAFSSLSFIMVGVNDGFSIDNVAFSAVPLPAALPLYGSGLAVMGFLAWRRKRKRAAAA